MNTTQNVTRWHLNRPILAGLVYAFVWMSAGIFTLSILLYISSISEDELKSYIYIVHCTALFIGGWASSRLSGKKGWYYGGITGLGYALLILLTGFLAMDAKFNLQKLIYLIVAFVVGALGGTIGVNMKSRSNI